MGWETEYQEHLAFKSEPTSQALEVELQSPGMTSKTWEGEKSSYRDELHKRGSWDPVMTSLLRNNATSGPATSFLHTAASSMNLGGFSKSSDDTATIIAGMDHSIEPSNNSAGILAGSSTSSPAVVLNAPSSAGATATKVSKKRSRASRRPPTTVLEADSANFRSMVQHLTGIPAPPPMLASTLRTNRFDFLGGASGLVRPQPTRALSFAHHATPSFSPAVDSSSGGGFFQYQPPYSLRKLEDFRSFSYPPRGSQGAYMDPGSSAGTTAGIFSSMQGTSSSTLINARPSLSATTPDGVYVAHSGNSTSSNLSMPSLWECDNRDGEASFNARIKREAEEARSSGRPIASWSTSNF